VAKKVIALAQAAPDAALLGLNRLTGLDFSCWPESLVNPRPDGDSSGSNKVKERDPATTVGRDEQLEKKQA
jgi:hypothetical protein